MRAKYAAIPLALLLASCATGPFDRREPWEVAVWATPVDPGVYSVRTAVVTPDGCFAPGETRTGPSTVPRAIQLTVDVTRVSRSCDGGLSEVVYDIPGLRVEPDDEALELVVSSEGVERNRIVVDFDVLGQGPNGPYTAYYRPDAYPRNNDGYYAPPPRY